MRKVNLSPKYYRLLIALSVCFLAGDLRAFATLSQRSSSNPTIALDMVKDDTVKPNEPNRVGQQFRVKVIAKNESADQVTVAIINVYYQNRPELLKNGKPVPYKSQIAKILS